MNEFTALEAIYAPGTMVAGYQRGDRVAPDVVENWGLTVGQQICEGDLVEEEAPAEANAQPPGPEATYADWQAYAIANGMPEDEAENATMDQLEAWQRPDVTTDPSRPADSAVKADWVAYVQAATDDQATKDWAAASTTTKADLQNWEPGDVATDVSTEA